MSSEVSPIALTSTVGFFGPQYVVGNADIAFYGLDHSIVKTYTVAMNLLVSEDEPFQYPSYKVAVPEGANHAFIDLSGRCSETDFSSRTLWEHPFKPICFETKRTGGNREIVSYGHEGRVQDFRVDITGRFFRVVEIDLTD